MEFLYQHRRRWQRQGCVELVKQFRIFCLIVVVCVPPKARRVLWSRCQIAEPVDCVRQLDEGQGHPGGGRCKKRGTVGGCKEVVKLDHTVDGLIAVNVHAVSP